MAIRFVDADASPGAADLFHSRLVRAWECGIDSCVTPEPVRCTLSQHEGPFHRDDNRRVSWCEDCCCAATDHRTASLMDTEEPIVRRDGSLATCGDCGECAAVLPEGWS